MCIRDRCIAKLLQPFLVSFQTSASMVPFLHSDLVKMIRSILERLIKPDVLSSVRNLHSIYVTDDKNLCTARMIRWTLDFLHTLMKELLSQKKVSDRPVMDFWMETRSFLQVLMKQLLLKSPVIYSLTKNLSALDPCRMADTAEHETNKVRFHGVIAKLTEAGRIPEGDTDEAVTQYVSLMDSVAVKLEDTSQSQFSAFVTLRLVNICAKHQACGYIRKKIMDVTHKKQVVK